MIRKFPTSFPNLRFPAALWFRHLAFWTGAVAVGVAAIGLAKAADWALHTFQRLYHDHLWLALALCPLTIMAALTLTARVFPGAQGSGIPQVIAAIRQPVLAERGLLSLRIAIGKLLMTLLGLLGGASIGREGPTVQIGAALMLSVGKWLRLPERELGRSLILAGGAAGVAAAFNAPLAGVVFAIEELSRSFEERTSGTVFTTVIVAGIVSLGLVGNYSYFGHTETLLTLSNGWLPILACGLICGIAGGMFARILILFSTGLPGEFGRWIGRHPIWFGGICGVLLAALGLISGGTTFGTGYEQTKVLLNGSGGIGAAFGGLKLVATVISYVSGIPGGIFAPSLATGAGIGAEIARFMTSAPAGAVILLGMAAYFSGVVQAPITAVVIVTEMTDNQTMTVPLMAAAFIAYSVSRVICPDSLYKALAGRFMIPDSVQERQK
jgi:H+/Cl- antiporter ClcA